MKKILVVLSVLGVAALALVFAGQAYAQGGTPPATPGAGVPGKSGFPRSGFRGVMAGEGESPLQPYMLNALSQEFGISPEELESMHEGETTLWDYASGQGMSETEFHDKMEAARGDALKQAAADGVISQEQADWMLSRNRRFGGGNCDQSDMRGGRGGRWQNAQPAAQP